MVNDICIKLFTRWRENHYWGPGSGSCAVMYHNIKKLLTDTRVDPSLNNNEIFKIVVKNNYEYLIYFLLKNPKVIYAFDNELLEIASKVNNIILIKMLLTDSKVDPSTNNNIVLKHMVIHNNIDIVKKLLNNPKVYKKPCVENQNNTKNLKVQKLENTNVIKIILLNAQKDLLNKLINENIITFDFHVDKFNQM